MLIPLPRIVVDMLLAFSITACVLVLLVALQILKPVQFSVFPSLLLLLTLFRLSLDLAASRRILLHGSEGPSAAGRVIEAFGQFVVGGNYVVGFVLFLALIAIQYMVVSHGAVRTAEVTARFTLDAMPGKQMAIDADLNAGLIDEKQARSRRATDCPRSGILRSHGWRGPLQPARLAGHHPDHRHQYHCRIPDWRLSARHTLPRCAENLHRADRGRWTGHHDPIAAGFGGGRHRSYSGIFGEHLGMDVGQQLFGKSRPLWIAAGVMAGLALIPGLPKISFALMSVLMFVLARRAKPETAVKGQVASGTAAAKATVTRRTGFRSSRRRPQTGRVDAGSRAGTRATGRQQARRPIAGQGSFLAKAAGFTARIPVPSIHITDNLSLKEREYVIYLRGVEIARWEMRRDCLLAISSQPNPPALPGVETARAGIQYAGEMDTPDIQAQAVAAGYVVVDHTSALATHMGEVVKQNAHCS